jgi:hypothetical protein
MKQTAIEWFAQQVNSSKWKFADMTDRQLIIDQAKAMEKQQLGKFYNHGQWTTVHGDTFEDHYNKIFKSE